MTKTRPSFLFSVCCLWLTAPIYGQTPSPAGGGSYFQNLVKDAKTRIKEIAPDKVVELRKEDPKVVVVDVREDNEWDSGRIAGAIHVGRGVLESSIESKVPQKSTPLVLYCHGGNRAAVAADTLAKMGYTNVFSIAGGLTAYEAAGLPVDHTSPPK